MARRLNLTALALSATLIAGGALAVLRWQPAIPGLGIVRNGGTAASGITRAAPATSGPGCRAEREVPHGGRRFLAACAGQAASFDGRYFVVKNAGLGTGIGLVRGGSGVSLDDLGTLDDGHPFTLFWSPAAHRFFANQQHEGGLDRFRLFEVRGERVIERPALANAVRVVLRERRSCLRDDEIAVSGIRWSADGRRIALLGYARQEACGDTGSWRPLWMIGDVAAGAIDPASIRARPGRAPLPADGPYATL